MIPQGKLIIIGGHEDKGEAPGENLDIYTKRKASSRFEILGSLIQKTQREHHRIEIIASASSIPDEMDEIYINAYKNAGFAHVGIIKVENKEDACNPDSIKKVKSAHAVFFTGGDQEQLILRLAGTEIMEAIRNKYYADEDFIVGGTSAGAMGMPEIIITGGAVGAALYKSELGIAKGFDLISDVIVDTHFVKRGRFLPDWPQAVILNPSCLGIGLEEDTALVITGGNRAQCIGSGMVILIDGRHIKHTNRDSVDDDTPIVADNLQVSILAQGSCYLLKERKFVLAADGKS